MTAGQFLSALTQLVYFAAFAVTTVRLVQRPVLPNVHISLFFGLIVVVQQVPNLVDLVGVHLEPLAQIGTYVAVATMPLLLLLLVDDFRPQSRLLIVAAVLGWVAVLLAGLLTAPDYPPAVSMLVVANFTVLGGYVTFVFLRAAIVTRGVTQRRMQAIAVGSLAVILLLLLALVTTFVPAIREGVAIVSQLLALASAVGYYLGFAPPASLRRFWQEPSLRQFLSQTSALARMQDRRSVVDAICSAVAATTGGLGATIGLYDADRDELVYNSRLSRDWMRMPAGDLVGGAIFRSGRARFIANAAAADPSNAELYRSRAALAILGAPIRSDDRPIGVLIVYADRTPLFAGSDLELVELLAEHSGVILDSHQVLRELSRINAREEAARLRDELLSAVAHDVRTPLTTVLLNAEVLARQARGLDETALRRLNVMVAEAKRLRVLVNDYLDLSRAEQGTLVRQPANHDLGALAREAVATFESGRHEISVVAAGPVIGHVDPQRVRQVIDNLVENAIKYSPEGGPVQIRVWSAADGAHISVSDKGIGIPAEDLPFLFSRFQRGANVDDRRFHGIGMGLYLCQRIVADHGGEISVESRLGQGSTFHVRLPGARATATVPASEPATPTDGGEVADEGPLEAGAVEGLATGGADA